MTVKQLPKRNSAKRDQRAAVLQLDPPVNGGTLYSGIAVSGRGRRYSFFASKDDKAPKVRVMREEPDSYSEKYGICWLCAPTPPSVGRAIRKAVLAA